MIRGGLVRLSVAELDRAVRFYIETLGLKLVSETEESAVIDCGDGFQLVLAKAPPGEHRGAVAVGLHPKMPLAEAIAILENRGVTFDASQEFYDPDGNVVYLLTG